MTNINPLTSPGEVVSVFTSPYLSAGAPALGETKGLINILSFKIIYIYIKDYLLKNLLFIINFFLLNDIKEEN